MFKYINLIVTLAILVPVIANADSDSIYPTDDSMVAYAHPTTNYGYSGQLEVGWYNGQELTLMKFDLSEYSGATINDADVFIYVLSIDGTMEGFTIARCEEDWDESTVIWNNMPNVGDYYGISDPNSASWWGIDVTGWVQDVADGVHSNFGWRLTGVGTSFHLVHMISKDSSVSKPFLSINFEPSVIESTSLGSIKAAFK